MQSVLFLILLALSYTAAFLVPNPPGKHNVSLSIGPLIDYRRNDPYAATPTPRALMVSVFQPAKCNATVSVPYMPNKTAEYQGPFLMKQFNVTANFSPLFEAARLPVCPAKDFLDYPILLFSPGYGIPRLYYSVLASAIASEGFIVITIDHPGDANIVEYPDGHVVYANGTSFSDSAIEDHLLVRIPDVSFVIDQLSNATAMGQLVPDRGARPFSTNRVGMFGHSLGGAAAVLATAVDHRLRAAFNWDGTLHNLTTIAGLSRPILFMSHENASQSDWYQIFPHLKGPKLWVQVANSTHEAFSDVPTLLQSAGQNATALAGLLGTIAPAEMVQILAEYTASWMRAAFTGEQRGLAEGHKPARFPKISIIKKGNL